MFSFRSCVSLLTFAVFTATSSLALAQETSAPVNNVQRSAIHQLGMLRTGSALSSNELLPLPPFVHSHGTSGTADAWIEASAFYIIPPQNTSAPMSFRVNQSKGADGAEAQWYPFALRASHDRHNIVWQGVEAGGMAEGPETVNPLWMQLRAVASAATLKVNIPEQPKLPPADAATTEGEVFLFLRAPLPPSSQPLQVKLSSGSSSYQVIPQPGLPVSESTAHVWLVHAIAPDTVYAQRHMLQIGEGQLVETTLPASLPENPDSSSPLELLVQLNEALVGNGLLPDEASVLSNLVLRSLQQSGRPALLYFVPRQWLDKVLSLSVAGMAETPLRVFVALEDLPTTP